MCGGSAPGANRAGAAGAGAFTDDGLGLADDDLFRYQAEPSATPSTLRMIRKGRNRFMVVGKMLSDGSGNRCRQRTKDISAVTRS